MGEQPRSRSASPEKEQQPKRKKYPHRSKQIRILEVHASLKEEYTARGLYADEDEVLRGEDTVRAHVKTFQGLNKIKDVWRYLEILSCIHNTSPVSKVLIKKPESHVIIRFFLWLFFLLFLLFFSCRCSSASRCCSTSGWCSSYARANISDKIFDVAAFESLGK